MASSDRVVLTIEFDNKVNVYNPGNRKIMEIANILDDVVTKMRSGDYNITFDGMPNGSTN